MKDKINFENIGGRLVRQVERKEPVDFSDIGGTKVGTVSDLFKKLYGEHGGLRIAPPAAVSEEEDSDE